MVWHEEKSKHRSQFITKHKRVNKREGTRKEKKESDQKKKKRGNTDMMRYTNMTGTSK